MEHMYSQKLIELLRYTRKWVKWGSYETGCGPWFWAMVSTITSQRTAVGAVPEEERAQGFVKNGEAQKQGTNVVEFLLGPH